MDRVRHYRTYNDEDEYWGDSTLQKPKEEALGIEAPIVGTDGCQHDTDSPDSDRS